MTESAIAWQDQVMSQTNRSELLIAPQENQTNGIYHEHSAKDLGWQFLNFGARKLPQGKSWEFATLSHEYVLVFLGGSADIVITGPKHQEHWQQVGKRANVFLGMPYALYVSRQTKVQVTATSTETDIAYGFCETEKDYPPQLVTPKNIAIELRGGENASRQINSIIPPGFACEKLVCVEVYTPSGNWSSYPPHKHDVHRVDARGRILEADLEEIYFYKIDKPHGYAFQRVYTDARDLDEVVMAHHNDMVLIPRGYHPVTSAFGYTTYYLNFLAGSAQSLACVDDPEHAWIKQTWRTIDPRLPLVSLAMED